MSCFATLVFWRSGFARGCVRIWTVRVGFFWILYSAGRVRRRWVRKCIWQNRCSLWIALPNHTRPCRGDMSSHYDGSEFYDSPFSFYDAGLLSFPARKKRMKVIVNLLGLSESEKVTRVQDVVTHMTGNAHFPSPNPALATVPTHVTTAAAKIAA